MLVETIAGQLTTHTAQPSPTFAPDFDQYLDGREDFTSSRVSEDDMAELSDSPSTRPSTSRPTTPLDLVHPSHPGGARMALPIDPTSGPTSSSPTKPDEPLSLALKAGRILGLSPGTLTHAQACLEYAREEVRRTAEPPSPGPSFAASASASALAARSRVSKMIKGGTGGGHGKTPSIVHIGTGSREDEERRERRRKAADSVIYWQREVQRLQVQPPPREHKRRS